MNAHDRRLSRRVFVFSVIGRFLYILGLDCCLFQTRQQRAVAATNGNEHSSRSHSIFTMRPDGWNARAVLSKSKTVVASAVADKGCQSCLADAFDRRAGTQPAPTATAGKLDELLRLGVVLLYLTTVHEPNPRLWGRLVKLPNAVLCDQR